MSTYRVVGVDPGPVQSAWVFFDGARVLAGGIEPNDDMLARCRGSKSWAGPDNLLPWPAEMPTWPTAVAFEQVEAMGMPVGRDVFETVYWTGRFFEATEHVCEFDPQLILPKVEAFRVKRFDIKLHLCQSRKANDSNIRTAILDRFGGKEDAVGIKAKQGPLYGVKSHMWSALAVALTHYDKATF